MTNSYLDCAILAFVRGNNAFIISSLMRLYHSGDIQTADIAFCVDCGLISLADYNDIISKENG